METLENKRELSFGNLLKGGGYMIIDILGSNSSGNSYIIRDIHGNQLLLECGLKYETIIPHLDFERLDCLLLSHYH